MGVETTDAAVDRLPVPVEGAGEELELTKGQRDAFFAYITADPGCSVKDACLAAGVKRRDVRRLRREDAEFDEDYRTARGYGPQRVMGAMVKLGIEGVKKPLVSAGKLVRDEDGEVVYETVYSDRILENLYKTGTPEGQPLLPGKATLEINGDVHHHVQRGVPLADVAQVLLDAGVDLQALADGKEVADAAEIVAVDDE